MTHPRPPFERLRTAGTVLFAAIRVTLLVTLGAHQAPVAGHVLGVSIAEAADIPASSTFPALGAPDDPKVSIAWNRFYDTDGLEQILRELNRAYPNLTELVEVGTSHQGRTIWSLEVTNEKTGAASSKPAMYIDGNIHGNEVQAGETVAYTAWYLCEMYGAVAKVTELLDTKAFYLIPTINPDGRDHWFHAPNNPHLSRSGLVPIDNDGDGRFDEDGAEDLDGDGHITSMWVADPWGRWKRDLEYPDQLMVRVDRDQRGEFTRLGWEGTDNDGDGEINEDGPGGYDQNRNWPWQWQPESVQYGAHDYPFSLPECRAIADYVLARPNIAGMQSYHNAGGMILRPPGQEDGRVHPADEELASFIAARGEQMLPGYDSFILWKDLYTVWGGEFEWFYGGRGIVSFTNELWTQDNLYRRELDDDNEESSRERAAFVRFLLQNQGLTPLHEFDHPELGEVLIGGMSKEFGRVPPSFMLEEELHRNMAFTLYHAESMPLLRFGEVAVESMGGGLSRVRVAVENHGIIPTRVAHDVENRITARDVVTLSGGGLRVVASGQVSDPRRDTVTWQEVRPERLLIESIAGLDRTFVDFLVTGSGTATVRVDSEKAGTMAREVRIP